MHAYNIYACFYCENFLYHLLMKKKMPTYHNLHMGNAPAQTAIDKNTSILENNIIHRKATSQSPDLNKSH